MSFDAGPAVRALQAWYGADAYASATGLYSWNDPAAAEAEAKVNGSFLGIDNLIGKAIEASGKLPDLEDTLRWWNSANAIMALIDYMYISNDFTYLNVIGETFDQAPHAYRLDQSKFENIVLGAAGTAAAGAAALSFGDPAAIAAAALAAAIAAAGPAYDASKIYYTNFLNNFYDDEGWWALTWIKAYDLTRDQKYLDMAVTIFNDMAGGWDNTFGGGIFWGKDHTDGNGNSPYKNAIANELFMAVAARLYLRRAGGAPVLPGTNDASYKTWAVKEATWFINSGLIRTASTPPPGVLPNLINDSLDVSGQYAGQNSGSTTLWTYNQGVILRALCDVSIITGDPSYRSIAENIANAAINYFVDANKILTELRYDGKVGTCQFKGVFMRNLGGLFAYDLDPDFGTFITNNAKSVLANGKDSQFGSNWSTSPPDGVDFVRQTAGIDAINAANRGVTPISLKKMLALVGQTPPTGLRQALEGLTSSVRGWVEAVTP